MLYACFFGFQAAKIYEILVNIQKLVLYLHLCMRIMRTQVFGIKFY